MSDALAIAAAWVAVDVAVVGAFTVAGRRATARRTTTA
jgi:hypothetical protein